MAALGERAGASPTRPDVEALAALALSAVPGLGAARIRRIVDEHGSARAALEAARGRRPDASIPPALRARLLGARLPLAEDVMRGLPPDARLVAYSSPDYPTGLRRLHDPPPVLYLRGPLRPDATRTVCVVGSRRANEYGRRMARRIGGGLAAAGWRVVSGLAAGIDAEAHRGALEEGGETVGVPGCGLRHVYPASSRELYRELPRRGLLLTEFPPDARPAPECFPRRNRILAGLARAVVVVQAGARSGALITVDRAAEIGVDVLAVPGPADQELSEGVHGLIRDGAGLVTGPADILAALGEAPISSGIPGRGSASSGSEAAFTGFPPALAVALGSGPVHVDDLVRRSGLDVPALLALLGRLEAGGAVRALPGGRFEAVR